MGPGTQVLKLKSPALEHLSLTNLSHNERVEWTGGPATGLPLLPNSWPSIKANTTQDVETGARLNVRQE